MALLTKVIEPRWERRKDARPGELTAAALEPFVGKGFAATRLDDVAKRAGVSKGTLYLYFESKEELFKAVMPRALSPGLARPKSSLMPFRERPPICCARCCTAGGSNWVRSGWPASPS
jgi:Bacterial regulatory proteins, tetR family